MSPNTEPKPTKVTLDDLNEALLKAIAIAEEIKRSGSTSDQYHAGKVLFDLRAHQIDTATEIALRE